MKIAHIKNNKVLQIWAAGDTLDEIKERHADIASEIEEVPDNCVCGQIKNGDAFENPPPTPPDPAEVQKKQESKQAFDRIKDQATKDYLISIGLGPDV